ncbi:branched-chain amino acid ABC transporter permease, partial [Mesorhizobium sp. M7A.F.Ca.CA.004.04.1.1]
MSAIPYVATEVPEVLVQRQTRSGRIAMTLAVLALIGVAAMPWWASTGTIRSILVLCCYIAVAQMWNLLAGYAGLVSV